MAVIMEASLAKQSRQFPENVSDQVTKLLVERHNIRSLPNDILLTALAHYKNGKLPEGQGRPAARELAEYLRRTMIDFEILTGEVRSLGKAGNANGVTIYSAKPVEDGGRMYLGAYFHALIFRQSEFWILSSIEPAMTTTHMHERILARSSEVYSNFTAAQKRLSAFWPLLIEAGNQLKRTRGSSQPIVYFAYPWADGLLLGNMQKVSEKSVGRPSFLRFRGDTGEPRELQDAYTSGDQRLLVFVKTFVGPDQMKPGQVFLADRMNAVVDAYPDVVEYLRLRWQIAHGFENEISSEIMRVMGLPEVSRERLQQAVCEIIAIIDTDEWKREAELNKNSQERYQSNAQRHHGQTAGNME
jgi:hypothetical protein